MPINREEPFSDMASRAYNESGRIMEEGGGHPKGRPAESFAVEYMKTDRITESLSDMGFIFERSQAVADKEVRVFGRSMTNDGTTIEIIVRKGDRYESPKAARDRLKSQTK